MMAAVSPFLSLVDMYDYLPNFDADCDLQVGDWVVVQPQRMAALLGPLISAWETVPQGHALSSTSTFAPRYALSQLLPEPLTLRRRSLAWNRTGLGSFSTRLPRLAPLSMARAHYCKRKRMHVADDSPIAARDSSVLGDDASSGNGNLYLHVRLGLLTPSRPYVFGGLDIVEVLGWPSDGVCTEEDRAACATPSLATRPPAVLYLNLLTGETLTREEAVRRTSKLMPSYTSSTATWSSAIEAAAEKEWQQWVLRRACIAQQQPCG
ncbi:hypothetical protein LSCM1_05350 [Leishmania martiniquensis]|uniref:Uncharacterized protein n=1 Tax=Leishmania martiniquensis TaxID=1580590 RepID=A0A836GKX8_9TRYP|nr:hypothetical protein LSCM1_05350 [Leishmania martiniquensis]